MSDTWCCFQLSSYKIQDRCEKLNTVVLWVNRQETKHVMWLYIEFRLVIGFIELLQLVPTNIITLLQVCTVSSSLQHCLLCLHVLIASVPRVCCPHWLTTPSRLQPRLFWQCLQLLAVSMVTDQIVMSQYAVANETTLLIALPDIFLQRFMNHRLGTVNCWYGKIDIITSRECKTIKYSYIFTSGVMLVALKGWQNK